MYNNISIKISRHRIKTKKFLQTCSVWGKVKEAVIGFVFGSLGFIVFAHVRLKENFGSV